jgi:hypothetical protein
MAQGPGYEKFALWLTLFFDRGVKGDKDVVLVFRLAKDKEEDQLQWSGCW